MGYFPNGTSGMVYEEQYCINCVHGPRRQPEEKMCAVWLAHQLYNYDAVGEDKNEKLAHVLDLLIPRSDEKLRNEQCSMFVDDKSLPDPNQMDLFATEAA